MAVLFICQPPALLKLINKEALMKIVEYKVVKDNKVMEYIQDGWVLQGGGFASHQGYFMQAIVRYEAEMADEA